MPIFVTPLHFPTMINPLAYLKRFGIDGFILCLGLAILLAWLFPATGLDYGRWSLPALAGYGVSLVFFLYGLKLDPKKLREGLGNWRLPLLIHISTFLLFPLLILPLRQLFQGGGHEPLWLGTFFLAALPSTVSSSIVMVAIAGGNIPAAIFNASISSILGVFITPLWMRLADAGGVAVRAGNAIGAGSGTDMGRGIGPGTAMHAGHPLTDTVLKLMLQVLLPIALGLFLNKPAAGVIRRFGKQLKYLDQLTILLIVFTAFCESFHQHMFSQTGLVELLVLALAMITLFGLAFRIMTWACRRLGFSRADRITAVFCGSKKSLVQGSVMIRVLFPDTAAAGLLLLPVMLYHAFQLIASSIIAQRMRDGFPPEATDLTGEKQPV